MNLNKRNFERRFQSDASVLENSILETKKIARQRNDGKDGQHHETCAVPVGPGNCPVQGSERTAPNLGTTRCGTAIIWCLAGSIRPLVQSQRGPASGSAADLRIPHPVQGYTKALKF